MGLFHINSNEYERLLKRVLDLETKNARLELLYDKLETNTHSLRGLVNRKLSNDAQQQPNEEEFLNQWVKEPL